MYYSMFYQLTIIVTDQLLNINFHGYDQIQLLHLSTHCGSIKLKSCHDSLAPGLFIL